MTPRRQGAASGAHHATTVEPGLQIANELHGGVQLGLDAHLGLHAIVLGRRSDDGRPQAESALHDKHVARRRGCCRLQGGLDRLAQLRKHRSGRLARRILAALRREARRRAEALKLTVVQQWVKCDVRAVGSGGGAQAHGPRLKKNRPHQPHQLDNVFGTTSRNFAPLWTHSVYAFSATYRKGPVSVAAASALQSGRRHRASSVSGYW